MTELSQSKVLVTGATGFLGSHLCRELVNRGSDVHALCRPYARATLKSVRLRECDLGDYAQVKNVLLAVNPDYLFHLAGFTSGSRELDAVLPSFQANLVSTLNLLTAAAEIGCKRIVLAGSLEEPHVSDEVPSSPYAASKCAAAAYARMFWHLYRTPVTVARIFMVYGPEQRDVKKLVPYTILSLLNGVNPQLSTGTRQVDWIYVDDAVSGLISLGQASGVEGEAVDIGTGVLTSVREVVEDISTIIDSKVRPAFGALVDRKDEQIRCAEIERTQSLIGWKYTVALEDGLQRTIEYYRQHLDLYPP